LLTIFVDNSGCRRINARRNANCDTIPGLRWVFGNLHTPDERRRSMVTEHIPIYQRSKGALGQYEDWWSLIIDTGSGAVSVEHEWSYWDPYGMGQPDAGTKVMSVDEFLQSGAGHAAKKKLADLLKGKPRP
jgi:hypothetical protein